MMRLMHYQAKFKQDIAKEDELAIKWILKRPTEVVGLEAKKAAIKLSKAKQEALKKKELEIKRGLQRE